MTPGVQTHLHTCNMNMMSAAVKRMPQTRIHRSENVTCSLCNVLLVLQAAANTGSRLNWSATVDDTDMTY